jgi:ribosome-associated protein
MESPDREGTDMTDSLEAPDTPQVPDASQASDASEAPDASQAPEAPENGAEEATSLIEAVARRDRQGEPLQPVDLETIHERALLAAEAASGVKAEEVKILDMHELVTYTDFLVLCTGRNIRLTKRIAGDVAFKLKKEKGILPAGSEGVGDGEWILLDYLDFMVHVFTPEAREFYRLDVLWKRAPVEIVE